MKFGAGGLALLSLLDASSIPIPMDLVLAGYVWGHRGQFWIYVVAASAGSALGGLVPYFLGRAGGELFLLRRMDRARFDKIRLRFEKQEFFAVLVPSMLPPPTPWKAFVFAAGVFEMRVAPFVLAVFCGRMVRWLLLSALVLRFGPGVVGWIGVAIQRHGWVMASALLLALIGLGLWAVLRSQRKRMQSGKMQSTPEQTAIPADEIK
jgi:membrane protein YqaA with SNARE-associated domain